MLPASMLSAATTDSRRPSGTNSRARDCRPSLGANSAPRDAEDGYRYDRQNHAGHGRNALKSTGIRVEPI